MKFVNIFNDRCQLEIGYEETILYLLDRSHAAGLSLGALSFYIALKQGGLYQIIRYKPRVNTNQQYQRRN